jgi:RNA polymerase sigma factor (sigma-70 family)
VANAPLTRFLRHLRRVAGRQEPSSLTDAQLLERFVTQHDEAAFELLLWRHEKMVLSTCRRVLKNPHDAEDAFQATFLTLVRKAGSIGKRASVAAWLHKVAYRIALQANGVAKVHATHERQGCDLSTAAATPDFSAEPVWRDLLVVLDQEVNGLPEKYRVPVVLCYLEGKTYEEAARQLGCPRGTVSIRLTRGRELLRQLLTRRGLVFSGSLLATVLSEHAAEAALPFALVDATVRAARLVAAAKVTASVVSPKVTALTEGMVRAMLLTKLKIIGVSVMLTVGIGSTAVVIQKSLADKAVQAPIVNQTKAAAKEGENRKEKAKTDSEQIQGKWVVVSAEVGGKPIDEIVGDVMIFDGNKGFVNHIKRDDTDLGPFELDPSKKPKHIDMTAKGADKPTPGIYELDGDKLTICIADDAEARPAKFATSPERPKVGLIVLKRANLTKAAAKAEENREAEPKADSEQIHGKWVVVSVEAAGKPFDEAIGDVMIFDNDKYFSNHVKNGDIDAGAFRLDSSKKPKQFDRTARGESKPIPGIYELDGDKLTICIADDTKGRPIEFATSPDRTMLYLVVLKRAKQ